MEDSEASESPGHARYYSLMIVTVIYAVCRGEPQFIINRLGTVTSLPGSWK